MSKGKVILNGKELESPFKDFTSYNIKDLKGMTLTMDVGREGDITVLMGINVETNKKYIIGVYQNNANNSSKEEKSWKKLYVKD